MKRKIIFANSVGGLIAAVAAILFALAAWIYHYQASSEADRKIEEAKRDVAGVEKKRKKLKTDPNGNLDALRARAATFKASLLNRERTEAIAKLLGSSWAWAPRGESITEDYRKQPFLVTHGAFSESEWMGFYQLIATLQSTDGVAIKALEIETQGDARERHISNVSLHLVLYAEK